MTQAVVGLGSNIEPEKNIEIGLAFLKRRFSVLQCSQTLKTAPIGMDDPAYFLNAGALIETDLTYAELELCLKTQESAMGRVRTKKKYSSRPIDLDILSWDGKICDNDVAQRDFLQTILKQLNT